MNDNISFLLVEPFLGGNIGASARAIKNMGFSRLELINPNQHLSDEAYAFAHGATDVLESAVIHTSFDQAISDKSIVVAVTRRLGKTKGMIFPIKEGTKKIADFAATNKVVIVFGREDKGLLNEETDKCGFVITIPSSDAQPSINLAQSVMLISYEIANAISYAIHLDCEGVALTLPQGEKIPLDPLKQIPHDYQTTLALATQTKLNELYTHIKETLKLLDYGMRGSEDLEGDIMRNISHLIGRYGLTDWEVRMLHGLCGRIGRKIH